MSEYDESKIVFITFRPYTPPTYLNTLSTVLAIQNLTSNYELTLDITKGNTLACWQKYHRFILYFTILSFAKKHPNQLKTIFT